MSRRPIRVATTPQLERAVREAGFDTYLLPDIPTLDFNRTLDQRLSDGAVFRPFLERNDVELVLDFNTAALTLVHSSHEPGRMALTTADLGIRYVACYLDPITSTMAQVPWADHWHLLESNTWIKWIWETAHSEELLKLGVPNIVTMPMAAANDDYDTSPLPAPDPGPVVAFMGHPASSWFRSSNGVLPSQLFAGLTAAAVRADMPDMCFHKIYYDLYNFAEPPQPKDDRAKRAQMSAEYFAQKFTYNAYLAIKQRDRFARFLKLKLGDAFELIGDHWETNLGLKHTPRIWDMNVLHARMRRVPICLNLMKGNLESGLNVRHFEVTANGGFLLTYATDELSKCFKIGEECDVFHDEAELLDKIQFYIDHDAERREIAAAGQRRSLSEHLYSHRITKLVELLRQAGMLPQLNAASVPSCTVPKIREASVTDTAIPTTIPST